MLCTHASFTLSKLNFSIFIEKTISSSTNFKITFSQRTDKLFMILLVIAEMYDDGGDSSSITRFLGKIIIQIMLTITNFFSLKKLFKLLTRY